MPAEAEINARPLAGRIALVTGASRGIGYALARELARAGAHIVALARTQGALEELDDSIRSEAGEATLVPCDVTDFEALDRLGGAIFTRWGRLDIFVGNAGMLVPSRLWRMSIPSIGDAVMAVNVTANWRLIRSLDPLLRASDAGRVVLISSGAGHTADFKPYWGPYATVEGCRGCLGTDLCGGDGQYLLRPRHGGQSGAATHPHARRGHAGRRSH